MLGTGIDIVEIDRVAELRRRYGERFRDRVFTPREWEDCAGNDASLAARFAAKEATVKALGSQQVAYHEIEVVREKNQRPQLHLLGRAAQLAARLQVVEATVSLSHCQEYAVAMVVLRSGADTAPEN